MNQKTIRPQQTQQTRIDKINIDYQMITKWLPNDYHVFHVDESWPWKPSSAVTTCHNRFVSESSAGPCLAVSDPQEVLAMSRCIESCLLAVTKFGVSSGVATYWATYWATYGNILKKIAHLRKLRLEAQGAPGLCPSFELNKKQQNSKKKPHMQ